MTWKGVLLVSVRLPDVVNNVVMDATERPINPDAGPKRAELWRAELVLVPRGASSYMLRLRGSLCDGHFCSCDLLRADIAGSR